MSCDNEIRLTDISPKDKPWEVHKLENFEVSRIYAGSGIENLKKSARMDSCSGWLEFEEVINGQTKESAIQLVYAHFCRVRHCPICQWRRSLFWRARFYQALPAIIAEYPTARFVFLTLTVKNCPVDELRDTIQAMNKAWHRFIKLKEFSSVIGWVRSTEVSKEKNKGRENYAHPHFHCLLMVPAGYFGKSYINQKQWREAWRKALRVDYVPSVRVQAVKSKKLPKSDKTSKNSTIAQQVEECSLRDGIIETLKYSVKPNDMIDSPGWFLTLSDQTHHLRFIACGGVFKDVLKKETAVSNNDMMAVQEDKEPDEIVNKIFSFLWGADNKKFYKLVGITDPNNPSLRRVKTPDTIPKK